MNRDCCVTLSVFSAVLFLRRYCLDLSLIRRSDPSRLFAEVGPGLHVEDHHRVHAMISVVPDAREINRSEADDVADSSAPRLPMTAIAAPINTEYQQTRQVSRCAPMSVK